MRAFHLPRERRNADVHMEVEQMGHWVVGQLARVVFNGLVVRGVHPFAPLDGLFCRVRVIHRSLEGEERMISAGVIWRSYDDTSGEAIFEFEDLALGQLVSAYLEATP